MRRNKDEIKKELDLTWDRLDRVLGILWNEVNNENRDYKIERLTRKRKRLLREETKLIKEYSKIN